jgi:hypothetical protein
MRKITRPSVEQEVAYEFNSDPTSDMAFMNAVRISLA